MKAELTAEEFDKRFHEFNRELCEYAERRDRLVSSVQTLASDAWDHAERLQAELTEARQKLAAAESAIAIADDERDELERENRSLKERLEAATPSHSCLPLRAWRGWWR